MPAAIVAVSALSLAACSSGTNNLSGDSASQAVALAVSAANHEGSFHFIDQYGKIKSGTTLTGDASEEAGAQSLTGNGGPLQAIYVDGVAYLRAPAKVLEAVLGISSATATKEAGKWISVTKSEKGYTSIVNSLKPSSELDSYIPQGHMVIGPEKKIRGIEVEPVTGSAPSKADTVSDLRVEATLYVSTVSPYVPVSGVLISTDIHGRTVSEVVVFTAWGEQVHPKAPQGAVPASTLATA